MRPGSIHGLIRAAMAQGRENLSRDMRVKANLSVQNRGGAQNMTVQLVKIQKKKIHALLVDICSHQISTKHKRGRDGI